MVKILINALHFLTYLPSSHRQLGRQQILSISGGLELVSLRFPIKVRLHVILGRTSALRLLQPIGFKATGLKPFIVVTLSFLGTGILF